MIFGSRAEAGQKLALELKKYQDHNPIILALPRGGVPVGWEIAKVLHAPLDILVACKIGAPRNPEFGIGAVAENGIKILDEPTIKLLGLSIEEVNEATDKAQKQLQERVNKYRKGKLLPNLPGKTAILVDDGLATGVTAKSAIVAVQKQNPEKIVFATPVCAQDSARELETQIDSIICLIAPVKFRAVGLWYKNFPQLSDQEVLNLLAKAK